jgi:hypothetical protein
MGMEMVMEMQWLIIEEMVSCLPMICVAARITPFASSPSESLSELRFIRFLMALIVGS